MSAHHHELHFMSTIQFAVTDEEIMACYPALAELRPHLKREDFLERVRRQQNQGYHLLYLADNNMVKAAAGFRLSETLAWGKILYIDDLITLANERRQGHSGQLLDWLIAYAQMNHCDELHLDSGHHRHDAHRLYLNKRLRITTHHFSRQL